MVSRSHVSGVLILAGLITFFAVGAILSDYGEYKLLAWCVLVSGSIVLFGGLQWHLLEPPRSNRQATNNLSREENATAPDVADENHDDTTAYDHHLGMVGRDSSALKTKGRQRSSFEIGMKVSGIVGLFLFATTTLLVLTYIFVNLHVNASYRVDFTRKDQLSKLMHVGRLPSGFSYSYMNAPYKRGKFSVVLRIGVGSLADPDDQIGLSALAQRVSLDSSNLYPSRYGVYSAFQSLGAKVAHTYSLPRSTLFVFTDIPASLTNLELTLALLLEVSMSQRPVDSQVALEKRVLRGDLVQKLTRRGLVGQLLTCSHFGPQGPVCERVMQRQQKTTSSHHRGHQKHRNRDRTERRSEEASTAETAAGARYVLVDKHDDDVNIADSYGEKEQEGRPRVYANETKDGSSGGGGGGSINSIEEHILENTEAADDEEENMRRVGATEVEKFFLKWYRPTRLQLHFAGNLDLESVKAAITRVFGQASRGESTSLEESPSASAATTTATTTSLKAPTAESSKEHKEDSSDNIQKHGRYQETAKDTSSSLLELNSVSENANKQTSSSKTSSSSSSSSSSDMLLQESGKESPLPLLPKPKPLSILTREEFNGLDLTLIVSSPYTSGEDAKSHFSSMLDNAFYADLLNRFTSRVFEETADKMSLKVGGHPEKGGWRRVVEILLIELRRLSEIACSWAFINLEKVFNIHIASYSRVDCKENHVLLGPDRAFIRNLLTTAKMVLEAKKEFAGYQDGKELIEAMAHHTDPNYLYQDPAQMHDVMAPFCNEGMLDPALLHLQATAQLLFKHFVRSVNHSVEFLKSPYDNHKALPASLTANDVIVVITDPVGRYYYGGDEFDAGVTGSYITHTSLARLVNKVLDAVIAPLGFQQVIHAEDVFMRDEGPNVDWIYDGGEGEDYYSNGLSDAAGGIEAVPSYPEPVVEMRYLHNHLSTYRGRERVVAEDGLPSYGTLVEYSRLKMLPHTLSDQDYKNASKELPTPVIYKPNFTFIDSYAPSGVKRYRLSNGLMVNLKQRQSGQRALPCDAPGISWIEVVSLGGRATQPKSLLGACELVDLNVPNGFTVEYWSGGDGREVKLEREFFNIHTVDQYTRDTGRPKLRCDSEAFIIRNRLHPKCVNSDDHRACNNKRFNFLKKLESIRLALSPVFDSESIEKAALLLEKNLLMAKRQLCKFADPTQFLQWRVGWDLQAPWRAHGDEDPRLQRVTPEHIKNLDPVKVGAWVREQFTRDRMEVKVVGDFDESRCYISWTKSSVIILAVIPKVNHTPSFASRLRERLGYDVFNVNHARFFNKSHRASDAARAEGIMKTTGGSSAEIENLLGKEGWRANRSNDVITTTVNCTLPGLFPGRAFIVAAKREYDRLDGNQWWSDDDEDSYSTILNILRRDNGYVSAVDSTPFTSNLVPKFGFYRVQWCVALGDGRQVEASVRALHDMFSPPTMMQRPFERSTFLISKSLLLSSIESQLQEGVHWLEVLRGTSLRPPAWFSTHKRDIDTLKDISETDVLGKVQKLTFEEVSDWFSRHLSGSAGPVFYLPPQINVGIVEPISGEHTCTSGTKEGSSGRNDKEGDSPNRPTRDRCQCQW
eukprot:jgi/Bigna1/68571/fgenesh1_pg.6_\